MKSVWRESFLPRPLDIAKIPRHTVPMTKTEQLKTYSAIYVTIAKNGKPRYSHFSARQMRLFPVSREVAEASFAAGATVYRKQPGTSIWAEGGAEVISA